MKKLLIFYIGVLQFGTSFTQTLSRDKFVDLANKIDSFVSKKDSLYEKNRSSQFIYVLVNINAEGRIDRLDLSGVRSDTIYKILQTLMPSDLSDWQCLLCKGKTIVIPLFYLAGNDSNDRIKQMFSMHYAKIPHKDMITEAGNTVLVRYLTISAQIKPFEESPPNRVIKVDGANKWK